MNSFPVAPSLETKTGLDDVSAFAAYLIDTGNPAVIRHGEALKARRAQLLNIIPDTFSCAAVVPGNCVTTSLWTGSLRLGARALVSRSTFVEFGLGYLSLGHSGLNI